MDIKRKKELLEIYKNRHPEMGVISYCCKNTGDVFLGISKDTKADFNITNVKLAANMHHNRLSSMFYLKLIRIMRIRNCIK